MFGFIHTINWTSWPARILATILTGLVFGLFWVFTDLTLAHGVLGWILFAIVFILAYAIGEELSGKILSVESGHQISNRSFSWKRILVGLLFFIGIFGTASAIYFLIKP